MTQIIQSIGGGIAAVSSQVGAQASVTHKNVAMVTAVVLLITEIGGAIGSAIGAAIRFDWFSLLTTSFLSFLIQLVQSGTT